MGRRVETSPEIAKAFAKALDSGARLLSATAIASGAVGGVEIVRHSNSLGLSVPVVFAAENDCLVSVKVEGNRGADNEFSSVLDPSQKLTYTSEHQSVYLHPTRADTRVSGRPASTWLLKIGKQEPIRIGYVCNTGLENPNTLQLGPKLKLILPAETTDLVDAPDNCMVSIRVDGSKGRHIFTNVLNPSKNADYGVVSSAFNLPPTRMDSRNNGRPASRWKYTLQGSVVHHQEFVCNTGMEDPNILIVENGEIKVAFPGSAKPEPTVVPTLTIPQVKATYDTQVEEEKRRIEESIRLANEEAEKVKIKKDAEEQLTTIRANATATAIVLATAISQPTMKPAAPPTTPTPILKPHPVTTSVSDHSEPLKKIIDDTSAKIGEKSKQFMHSLYDMGDLAKEFVTQSVVDGYSQVEPHLDKILKYSVMGMAGLFMFQQRNKISNLGKRVGRKSYEKVVELLKAKDTQKIEPLNFQSNPSNPEPVRSQRSQKKSEDVNYYDMSDNSDLLFDAKGNHRLPKDPVFPKREISGEAIAAVTRGEKINGPLTGRELDQYDLKELLGYGSYSSVYKAYDSVLRADRAIKVLRPELQTDSTLLNQFSYEARILGSLDHPNIVKLYGFGNGTQKYIVTEYIEGRPLHAFTSSELKPPTSKAIDIVSQIAAGLDYAHSMGVSHNDLHPKNIVLGDNGIVKIVDFGSANHALWTELNNRHEATALVYTAPEVIRGVKPSIKSDIYAFGVLSFQLITGRLPSQSEVRNKFLLLTSQSTTGQRISAESCDLLLSTLSPNELTRLSSLRHFAVNLKGSVT